MKKFFSGILFLLCFMGLEAQDKDGHHLVRLWDSYYKAEKADKPREQLDALEKIRLQATRQGLAWDFYDAGQKLLDVRSSINWKSRDSVYTRLVREASEFGEPIVLLQYRMEDIPEFVESNKDKLFAGHNPEFYKHYYGFGKFSFSSILPRTLSNDYEYCLWYLYSENYYNEESESHAMALENYFKGRYPLEALSEFVSISKSEDREKLKDFAERYRNRAVSLLAEQDILSLRFRDLNSHEDTAEEDYRKLYRDCLSLIEAGEKFKGLDAEIAKSCENTENMIRELEHRSVYATLSYDELKIILRNLPKIDIRILDSSNKTIVRQSLSNGDNSFYLPDTLSYKLDESLTDGEYKIILGEGQTKYELNYDKHSLAIALRRNSEGYGVFVADHISGEPVREYRLSLFDNSRTKVHELSANSEDGFSPVPDELMAYIKSKYGYSLQASLLDSRGDLRLSNLKSISPIEEDSDDSYEQRREETVDVELLSDRRAYIPGDSIQFKAILYRGYYDYTTLPRGKNVRLALKDRQGKTIYSEVLSTNEFGSAAGTIHVPKDIEGGNYSLGAEYEGKHLGSINIRIDEFVLPTFDLNWNDTETFLPGDIVRLSGNIRSYSGHTLSDAKISYSVRFWNETVKEGMLDCDEEGNFSISFNSRETKSYQNYRITVKATEAGGETLEFSKNATVYPSLNLHLQLSNAAEGLFNHDEILLDETAKFKISHKSENVTIAYKLLKAGRSIISGNTESGDLSLDFSGLESGLYSFVLKSRAVSDSGIEFEDEQSINILKLRQDDDSLNEDIPALFVDMDRELPAVKIGSTAGRIWAVAELYGNGNVLLDHKTVSFVGEKGRAGSLQELSFPMKASYPDELSLKIIFFKNGQCFQYTKNLEKTESENELPLRFTRFLDTTLPSREYSFKMQSESGVECVASIFDVSTESIYPNNWRPVSVHRKNRSSVRYDAGFDFAYTEAIPFQLANKAAVTGSAMALSRSAVSLDSIQEESASDFGEDIAVREVFANTLAWEPFLRSDKSGNIDLSFRTSDKLSTYYVQLFAHDKKFRNAVLRQEFVVSLPIKIAISEPRFLYEGDEYAATVSLSNSMDKDIAGQVSIQFGNNAPISEHIVLAAKGSNSFQAKIKIREQKELMVSAAFVPDNNSYAADAIRVKIPVKAATQTISEAHSALLHDEAEKDDLIESLRAEFVNVSGEEAVIKEISISQLLEEAIEKELDITREDALSLASALYADAKLGGKLSESERNEIVRSLLACRNSDGGFGWFPGMSSSPVITAALLEKFDLIGGNLAEALKAMEPDAIRYIDCSYFSERALAYWRGRLSLAQYIHLRSLYPEIGFSTEDLSKKALKEFRKEAGDYLTPSRKRALNGEIFEKARRASSLLNLIGDNYGTALLADWGIRLRSSGKLNKSLNADLESLSQYAVRHKSGGVYFPNAVMPYRGLLEDELYAHSLICSLMDFGGYKDIAEGIRLWIMVQKENQNWQLEPGYIDALDAVSKASGETLGLRVIALSAASEIAFGDIKPAGNGYSVSAEYFIGGKKLDEGDTLRLGDKISARYSIRSSENRSFVRLVLPRPAALRPIQQLSGYYGWIYGAYREVKADRTEFFFESYPEELSVLSEEFFVSQEGIFNAPAPTVESLYAPHYRANGSPVSAFKVE